MATSKQQLSLFGAVAIGMASMLGAGVFFVWSAAWDQSHDQIFFALVLAAAVASLNAASVYQLASNVSRAGGVYAYSRVYLPERNSFIAGFSFVFGKIASIAAIALIIESYVLPGSHIATISVAALTVLNLLGINRTAQMAAVLSITTVVFLVFSIYTGFHLGLNPEAFTYSMLVPKAEVSTLSTASIIFFAFAGYARVATLGDEVRNPKKNIPLAIAISLVSVLVIYLFIALVVVGVVSNGNELMPAAVFEALVGSSVPGFVIDTVVVGASLGSILALLAGVSRTAATMAEDGELPRVFEHRNRYGAPWLAEFVIAIGAIVLIESKMVTSWVIGFSSLSVLIYYGMAHVSVMKQPKEQRKQPIWMAWAGLVLCFSLAVSVPGPALGISLIILHVALLLRFILRRPKGKARLT